MAQAFDPLTLLCQAHHLPEPEREVRFHHRRRWRFDYCWRDAMLALEKEGAVWVRGRHTRGSGFIRDMEKYNYAAVAGWRVLRCTPKQIQTAEILPILRTALERFWHDRPWPNERI